MCGNYSREETIQGRKLYEEVRYLLKIAFNYWFLMLQVKPFCQWEKLDMTALERRKLFCSVTFHIVAITCVVWSLYVLIDRTAEEIRNGELQWPFWTKLVVVAIGFTGGLVFMYIQCKVYVHLCRKWKAYNRTIVVQVSCIHIFLSLLFIPISHRILLLSQYSWVEC